MPVVGVTEEANECRGPAFAGVIRTSQHARAKSFRTRVEVPPKHGRVRPMHGAMLIHIGEDKRKPDGCLRICRRVV